MKRPLAVCDGVYMVGSGDLSHPYDCCVYLLDLGDLVLIDAGAGTSFSRLVSNIESLGFDMKNLAAVLATHAHIDHIGSIHEFQEMYGVKVIAHELDAGRIEEGRGIAAEAYGVDYVPCHVDERLQGPEEVLQFPKGELRVVHIPGHTPGSVAAYLEMEGQRVLFGQDVHGPYYPEWGADPELARESLRKLLDLRADILCEGHFGMYEPAQAVERYIRSYLDSL